MLTPGKVIKDQLASKSMTAADLARATDCSPQMLSDVLHNRRTPSANLAHRIFVAIEMPVEKRRECVNTWAEPVYEGAEVWNGVADGSCP